MNKIWFYVKSILISLFRLILTFIGGGESCVVCGKTTPLIPLCSKCKNEYYSTQNLLKVNRCSSCGRVLLSTEENCLQCRENPVLKHTDKVISLFSYRLWNKELMFLWKQNEIRSLSFLFAKFISDILKQMNIEYIVPVPPRPGKKREKGWDQIEELCTILRYKNGFKIFPVLKRKTIKQQKKLNRESRLETIGNAYSLVESSRITKIIHSGGGEIPEKVCIIDDVTTTGATLESCAVLIKKMGVKEVNAVTLFIVD